MQNQSYFHKNGFVLRLALKERHKGTRKWPIQHTYGHLWTWGGGGGVMTLLPEKNYTMPERMCYANALKSQ